MENRAMKILRISKTSFPENINGGSISAHELSNELVSRYNIEINAINVGKLKRDLENTQIIKNYQVDTSFNFSKIDKYINESDLIWIDGSVFNQIKDYINKEKPIIYWIRSEFSDGELNELCKYNIKFIVSSEFMKNRTKNLFNIETEVIYPVINEERVITDINKRTFITFINPHLLKGGEIINKIIIISPDIEFMIVGAWALNMDEINIIYNKFYNVNVTHSDVIIKNIYSKTNILVVPSMWEEAHGRVVREAQLNGIPVIVSNRGGLPETVGNGGIIIEDYKNANKYREALIDLLTDEDYYQKLSQNAKNNTLRFNNDNSVEKFYNICLKFKGK